MIIQKFPSGPFDTNAYIVACAKTRRAALVDPAPGSAPRLFAYLSKEGLIPEAILLTHTHWDHTADVQTVQNRYHIPLFVHALDAENLRSPGSDGLPFPGGLAEIEPDRLLEEGDRISVGELEFEVIHTPGHSPGGVCFYEKSSSLLLSGDTLFKGAIGNLAFPTSDPEKMRLSLQKLSKLSSETAVFPGHGDETSIGKEIPFLEMHNLI